MSAPLEITTGCRVIRKDGPDFNAATVTGVSPSGRMLSVIYPNGGTLGALVADFIAVPIEYQNPPALYLSEVRQIELMHDDAISKSEMDGAEARDKTLDALASKVYSAKNYVRWVQAHLYPLDTVYFEPRLLQAKTSYQWAVEEYDRAMAAEPVAAQRVAA